MTQKDAFRLADQATFGATEAVMTEIRTQGTAAWLQGQMARNTSRYVYGGSDAIHKTTSNTGFCDQPANAGPNCWRDYYSSQPLVWDFYGNATTGTDQLRQRVAYALQQIVVVNNFDVEGTYGLRNYHNMLLDNAFGNWRELLRKVTLSPVMGDFLNNANNDKASPNENFARELLQLFSIGTCALNADGTLQGGTCAATYNNDTVRNYAYALTGWTYPAGGTSPYGCWPTGANCRYYTGDMVAVDRYHDKTARPLLSGFSVPANSTAPVALERVLDSLMAHPNVAPFVAKQLIQHLVASNPSGAYVQRVGNAFNTGRYTSGGITFGTGTKGDLAATVAAVLLDAEARAATPGRNAGRLREPILQFTAVLRAFNSRSDGEALAWWWGEALRQHVFRPPSVFSFYPPDYPVPGTSLVGGGFGIHNANAALGRLNFLTYLFMWGGSGPVAGVPNAIGTQVDLSRYDVNAGNATALVDRLALVATGGSLPPATRTQIIQAVEAFPATTANNRLDRIRQAAYLVFASPAFQVQR